MRGLAVGITSLVNAFDPEIVVLGGGIAECGPALFDLLQLFSGRSRMAADRRSGCRS